MVSTIMISVGVAGWCSSRSSSSMTKNSSFFSSSKTMVSANRPWLMLLREELRLPWAVMGPLDLAPLAREAAICLGVLMAGGGDIREPGKAADSERDVIEGKGNWTRERCGRNACCYQAERE